MKLGVIADDFTGASDIALTLAEGGMPTTQYVGVPTVEASDDVAAGVVALKSRTVPSAQAVAESLAACDWLVNQGVKQIVLKVCSTFDSTPQGNIGPVLEALAERLGAQTVLVCPAFPENGRSVYQGHLFVEDKLLSESGMQDHPLTPMTDPDLRRVLRAQTRWPVGHIPIREVAAGAEAVRERFEQGPVMYIVDAIADDDLRTIGTAAHDLALLCGGSGIALGLPLEFGYSAKAPKWEPVSGPGVILSGSCSRATRAQVDAYKAKHPAHEITCADAVNGAVTAAHLVEWVQAQTDVPLIFSSADPDVVAQAQAEFGAARAAEAIETLFSDIARRLVASGTTRVVVAGGETSGAVTTALGARALQIGPRIAAGVPVLRMTDQPVALALKSGNFGDAQFFDTALTVMGGHS